MSTALKILVWLAANKELVSDAIRAVQSIADNAPGDSKAAAVRDFIREAMDMNDPDDKSWEPAWRIVRPVFDLLVATAKGKLQAKLAAAA